MNANSYLQGETADNPMVEIFTVANDKMARNLATLLYSIKENSGYPLSCVRVIPFDENLTVVTEICNLFGVPILQPKRRWDRLGRQLFTDEEYRPNVPAWRYFRKLNALSYAANRFAFMDANTVVLGDIRPVFAALDEYDVIIGNHSAPGRNFRPTLEMILNIANPDIETGFNAGFWLTKFDPKFNGFLQTFGQYDLRPLLTRSPEQSVLSMGVALSGKKIGKVDQVCPGLTTASAKRPVEEQEGGIVAKAGKATLKVVSMKWTGNVQINDEMPNQAIYLRYLKAAKDHLIQGNPEFFEAATESWPVPYAPVL